MECPECTEEIPERARFCSFCGIPLRRCPTCYRIFLPTAEFCGSCGATLAEAPNARGVVDTESLPSASKSEVLEDDKWLARDRPDLYGFFYDPRYPERRIPLPEGDHTIGAGDKNDIIVDRPAVSWNHALLVARNDRLLLQDSASTNGTYVNRVRVTKPRELTHGDLIRFGNVEYRVWIKPQIRNRS